MPISARTRDPGPGARGVLACLFVLLGGCAGTQGYYMVGQLQLNPEGQVPQWQVTSGSDVVLVVYRSKSGAQESGDNEELVVELDPAVMTPGTYALDTVGRVARYQRGGQVLTYVATHVSGSLEVKRGGDTLAGTVALVATEPTVDVLKVGTVKRELSFSAPKKSP